MEENKRQLCIYEQATAINKPWLWWDFVGGYGTRCTFANGKFNDVSCAQTEVEALGLNNSRVLECMEYSFVDKEHPLLQVRTSNHLSMNFAFLSSNPQLTVAYLLVEG